ncbi:MAG: hypothetical protein ACJA1L_003729 [Paracoccaceae bacterium]|jgi:hypothetical protein
MLAILNPFFAPELWAGDQRVRSLSQQGADLIARDAASGQERLHAMSSLTTTRAVMAELGEIAAQRAPVACRRLGVAGLDDTALRLEFGVGHRHAEHRGPALAPPRHARRDGIAVRRRARRQPRMTRRADAPSGGAYSLLTIRPGWTGASPKATQFRAQVGIVAASGSVRNRPRRSAARSFAGSPAPLRSPMPYALSAPPRWPLPTSRSSPVEATRFLCFGSGWVNCSPPMVGSVPWRPACRNRLVREHRSASASAAMPMLPLTDPRIHRHAVAARATPAACGRPCRC